MEELDQGERDEFGFNPVVFELLLVHSGWGQPSETNENGGIWDRGQGQTEILVLYAL